MGVKKLMFLCAYGPMVRILVSHTSGRGSIPRRHNPYGPTVRMLVFHTSGRGSTPRTGRLDSSIIRILGLHLRDLEGPTKPSGPAAF